MISFSVQIVSAVLGSIGLQNFASGEGIDVRVNLTFRILILFPLGIGVVWWTYDVWPIKMVFACLFMWIFIWNSFHDNWAYWIEWRSMIPKALGEFQALVEYLIHLILNPNNRVFGFCLIDHVMPLELQRQYL